jgi:hypothetical protein
MVANTELVLSSDPIVLTIFIMYSVGFLLLMSNIYILEQYAFACVL